MRNAHLDFTALIARSRNFRAITVAKLKTANWKKQLKKLLEAG